MSDLRAAAARLLPGADEVVRGQFHDVVLAPGRGVVRVARSTESARLLPRRTALLARLSELDLSFEVPRPLGDVVEVEGLTAVVLSWVPGTPVAAGSGDPVRLRALLDELAAVPLAELDGLLDAPHAYAGRERWESLLRDEVVPLLPDHLRAEAVRRVDAACDLAPVEPTLVHGDLAGANMHWDGDRLVGVLDWDLASAFDPAVDAACLAWHGWDTVAEAVDATTLARARTWFDTFVLEQVAAAVLDGGRAEVDAAVAKASSHLAAH